MDFMGIGPARYVLVAPRTINKFAIASWFKKKCLVRDSFRKCSLRKIQYS